jgi:hypothetical protein
MTLLAFVNIGAIYVSVTDPAETTPYAGIAAVWSVSQACVKPLEPGVTLVVIDSENASNCATPPDV